MTSWLETLQPQNLFAIQRLSKLIKFPWLMNCWEQNKTKKKKNEKDKHWCWSIIQIKLKLKNAMCLSALSSQLDLIQETIHYINTKEISGKTIMLSSNIKKSPLLWLGDNLLLCPSSLYIRTTKNILQWNGLVFHWHFHNKQNRTGCHVVLFKPLDDGCSSI